MKARIANDELSEARIAAASTPLQCKQLGDRVRINRDRWNQECEAVMKRALFSKFIQNKLPRDILLQTGTKTLAEANNNDLYWGTGLGLKHDHVLDPNQWKGTNRLGHLLMDLRKTLSDS